MEALPRGQVIAGAPTLRDEAARLWLTVAAVGGALAFLRGVRPPGDWAATAVQIDYSQGLVKRGLTGALLGAAHLPVGSYAVVCVVSFAALAALAAAVILLVRRGARTGARFALGAAVFLPSAAVTWAAHLCGYADVAGAAAAAVLVGARLGRTRLFAAAIAAIVGILAHEAYLLLFLPVTLLPGVLEALRTAPDRRALDRELLKAAALAALGLALASGLSLHPLGPAGLAEVSTRLTARADFPLRGDALAVLGRTPRDNFRLSLLSFPGAHLTAVLVLGPPLVLLLGLASQACRDAFPTPARARAAVVVVSGAALSPLVLNLVGWDHVRWAAWAVFDAFLGLYAVSVVASGAGRTPFRSPGPRWAVAAVVVILLGADSDPGLMDGCRPWLFPFASRAEGWRVCRGAGLASPTPPALRPAVGASRSP